ncbi:MFS transporter [Streptomyces sp. NBC_01335]|uniref:MFS transporter n=1 Tax=Streptomyces sp. NBC_01335 TaxID=2903828 RepID=UPI002E0DBA84|nr:MFS transporter [Streptomyces sp. NBC_01335]
MSAEVESSASVGDAAPAGEGDRRARDGAAPRPRDGKEAPRTGHRPPLPRSYLWWLGGILTSLVGNSVLYFALGWAAGAHGGGVAGLALSAITLPRVLFLLVGGAVGDRVSARRVLITGDAAMLAFTLVLAAVAFHLGTPPWLLMATGVAIGVVDAFYLPASGSMPRRLVDEEQLPRALSLRQVGGQVIAMGGGPLGGALVGLAGLAGAALVDAGTFALTLVVLLAVRPRREAPVRAPEPSGNILKEAMDGIRVAFVHPILRPALCLTGFAAGFLLPVLSLLLPLLAREREWGASGAGLVIGAQGVGMVAITLAVVKRGPLGRPGLLSAGALVLAGTGVLVLALAPGAPVAVLAGLVIGAGNGLFSAHIGPLVLASAPESHLSRVQAVLVLVQSLALLLMNNVFGTGVDLAGAGPVLVTGAVLLIGAGLAGLASAPLRNDRTGLPAD